MAPQVEITIPSFSLSSQSRPYTVYDISLRLPLRSFTIQKRYSDFTTLHTSLSDLVGSTPPVKLPAKTWFSSTNSNPERVEERRKGLEGYLQTINTIDDSRWRTTTAWRAFLNLPSTFTSQTADKVASSLSNNATITDPVVWLDCHRDLKTQLHNARLSLTSRDQALNPQQQHEASAAAKSALVKATGMIKTLEEGLVNIQKAAQDGWGSQKLGDGELRRRKDLIASAKKDRDGLEDLLNAMATKLKLDTAVASLQQRDELIGSKPRKGRVLGKETEETRELDNAGVLQLQKQRMAEQDQDVDELRKIVLRQKELGLQINQELEVQNEMLRMVEEDVDRVQGKVDIAKKRIGRIS